MPSSHSALPRRKFLASAAKIAAGGILHGCNVFHIVPRHVLGGKGFVPPSEKIRYAAIGLGGRGVADVISMIYTGQVDLAAFCDVDFSTLEPGRGLNGGGGTAGNVAAKHPDVPRYQDWRLLFDEMADEIDAVTVSTPDHSHFPISMAAIESGIHVFCQKPLTHNLMEARLVTEAAREKGVATQTGIQGHAGIGVRKIHEWYSAGALGKVSEVHIWTGGHGSPHGENRPKGEDPIPANLNWDVWLGPAAHRPYLNRMYHPGTWRAWFDFGTGALGDFGAHSFDIAYWVLNLGYPEWVEAESTPPGDESFPRCATVTYQFPARGEAPPVKVTWYGGSKLVDGKWVPNMPPRPSFLEEGRELRRDGQLYYAEDGKSALLCGMYGESPRIIPETKMRKFLASGETEPMERSIGLFNEFARACKGGEPACANFDYAGPLTEILHLGNMAILTEERITFDVEALATNSAEANKLISREYREGWG